MYVCVCVHVCVYLCDCLCTCVFMAQRENNSSSDSNTQVLLISPCSHFSTCKARITIHLADIEMNPNIKHLEIALLDIKQTAAYKARINETLEAKVFLLVRLMFHSGRIIGSGFVLASWNYTAFPSENPITSSRMMPMSYHWVAFVLHPEGWWQKGKKLENSSSLVLTALQRENIIKIK